MVDIDLDAGEKLPIPVALVAGGLSGCCYWLSCFPIDVIKNRIQAVNYIDQLLDFCIQKNVFEFQAPDVNPPVYRSFSHAAKHIYKTEGIAGLFAGFTPCMLRAFPANAVSSLK